MIDSRRKGLAFEQAIVRYMKGLKRSDGWSLLPDARRGIQSRGEEKADVVIPRIWVECKRGRQPNIRRAIHQASLAARPLGLVPMVISRADLDDTLVTLRLDDFADFLVPYFESDQGT